VAGYSGVVLSSTIQSEGNTDAGRDLDIKADGANLGAGTERKEQVKVGKDLKRTILYKEG
jgi:hypothetical protein